MLSLQRSLAVRSREYLPLSKQRIGLFLQSVALATYEVLSHEPPPPRFRSHFGFIGGYIIYFMINVKFAQSLPLS